PPPATPPPPEIETAKFIENIKPVEKAVEPPPPQDQLVDVQIGNENKEGEKLVGPPPPPPVDEGKGVVAPPPPEDENKVFEKVEIEASVNVAQWRRHLENQLGRYIEDAASSGMAPGNYTVNIRFLVERDGSITDVKALNDPGYGLAQGAVDVVKRGPKWSPGEQNGKKVRSYHTQPITFQIQEN
ncbi:MAG TPA: energy transducer TonB, partial [Flavisolibacter sp.]|nr:energy transducer TonB [Flavisolibacter sp.]